MLDKSRDVVAVMLVTLVALVLALLGLHDGIVVLLLGVPLALVFPGYAVIAWWAQGAFPLPLRLVLSVGLSAGLTSVVSALLAWTPWGLQIWAGTLVLGGITLGAATAALRRRTVVFVYAIPYSPTLRHPLVVAAGSGFVLALLSVAWTGATGRFSAATSPLGPPPTSHPAASPSLLQEARGSAGPTAVASVPAPPPAATRPPAAATTPRPAVAASDPPVAQQMTITLSDWPTRRTATARQEYRDGQYRVALTGQPSLGVSSRLPTDAYRLRIDIALEHGAAGLVFLAAEPTVFYRILFDAERGYAIQRITSTDPDALPATWTKSPAVQPPLIHLRIERRGTTLQFFANDDALTTFTVPDGNVTNHVGVALVDASGQGQATFSNLVVERVEEAP